jgi:hypothetical protein
MPISRLIRWTLPVLALALAAAPALAEDEPPPYGAADLALEDDGLAEGWEISYDELPGTPGEGIEEWIVSVGKACGLDEDALYTEYRILKGPEAVVATLAVVEVEGELKSFPETIEARGKAQGYTVRSIGHPSRILVLACPESARQAVLEMELNYAVRILSELGFERLETGSNLSAMKMAQGARKIDAKAGVPFVVLGMAATKMEKWDEAIEAFRAGFAKSATVRAKGRLAMRGFAHYGYACLQKKDPTLDREGRDAFEKCIALEEHAEKKDPKFIQRYNYACALSRVSELDTALDQLEMALAYAKIHFGPAGVKQWIQTVVVKDEDLKPIMGNPRFKALVDKFTGGAGTEDVDGL